MNILSEKIVKIRKSRRCNACARKFEPGTKMLRQVNDFEGLHSWYSCDTCQLLLNKHSDYFVEDNIFYEDCIRDALERDQTPEELLKKLEK